MSGDLQAKKRRDKKKRREDGPELLSTHQTQPQQIPTLNISDDLNIHIHKDVSTGGGVCAKLVFFVLLSLLTALIGLTITEYRGLKDLETTNSNSYIAQLFEEWIDKPLLNHESDEDELSLEHSEHLIEDSHEQSHSEEEDEDDEEEEEEEEEQDYEAENSSLLEEESESAYTREETVEDNNSSVMQDETAEVDSGTQEETAENDESSIQDTTENDTVENDESTLQDETTETYESTTQDETAENDESTILDDTAENDESSILDETAENDDSTILDETAETYKSAAQDEDEATETAEELEETNIDEAVLKKKNSNDPDVSNESSFDDEPDEEEDEDTAEKPQHQVLESEENTDSDSEKNLQAENVEHQQEDSLDSENLVVEKVSSEAESEDDRKDTASNLDEDTYREQSNLVVKFGVGTALLVVAYVVLIKKWKTDEASDAKLDILEGEDALLDLSRRNTIVSPPNFEEIEPDIIKAEEEYSEEEDYDSEAEEKLEPAQVKMHYAELQSKYDDNTLSPYWQSKYERERSYSNDYEDEDDYEEEEIDEEENSDDEEHEKDGENSNEEESENENEELLRRLEDKYGKLNRSDDEDYEDEDFDYWKQVHKESDSEDDVKPSSGAQSFFDFGFLTNSDDMKIQEELDNASQNDAAYALTLFNKILEKHPFSPRALYGKAHALDNLAEQRKSNSLLQQAILGYQQVLTVANVPDPLFKLAAERCIDRMRFRGMYHQAVLIHKSLINNFPDDVHFRNELAVTYLTINRIKEAQDLLEETLSKWPENGFALVHYGFILKTSLNDLPRAVEYLERGISTKESGVIDGRFFFHLGDALTRLGKNKEALKIYEKGVNFKLFLSKYQRSLYNVDRLTGKPWWNKDEFKHVRFLNDLESNWKVIRQEGFSVLNEDGLFLPEVENLRDVGDWKQFELYARGVKNVKNCKRCPRTCKIIETLPDAVGCKRGQIKFSVMHPGTHVWPHCGPTNCRLRIHLGLKIPTDTHIRVGENIRSWEEGKVIIFDDSFEHEVWHNGTSTRLVLIVDIWHPELTAVEKQRLSPI